MCFVPPWYVELLHKLLRGELRTCHPDLRAGAALKSFGKGSKTVKSVRLWPTWEEFVELPERTETGGHYELHDGEVVRVLPPADRHIALQAQIMRLLRPAEVFGFEILMEFPYRPTADLQYWKADVAIVPTDVRKAMARRSGLSWQVYAPPLVVEVLSPSNTDNELNRKRVVAMSAGTVEFWIVDGDSRTVHVTTRGGLRTYRAGENIALSAVAGVRLAVDAIFEDLV